MSKGVKKKGFTLVELVVVLAIFGLLASITGLGLYSWTRYSINKENNENARTIFLAAQESLTHMQASGTLSEYANLIIKEENKTPAENISPAINPNISSRLYTIFYTPGSLENRALNTNEAVRKMLSPYLEGTGVFNHAFAIEFDPQDGVVYSVLYSKKADSLSYDIPATSRNESGVVGIAQRESSFLNDRLVGYYVADLTDIRPTQGPQIIVTEPVTPKPLLVNEEELYVHFDLGADYQEFEKYEYEIKIYSSNDSKLIVTLNISKTEVAYIKSGKSKTVLASADYGDGKTNSIRLKAEIRNNGFDVNLDAMDIQTLTKYNNLTRHDNGNLNIINGTKNKNDFSSFKDTYSIFNLFQDLEAIDFYSIYCNVRVDVVDKSGKSAVINKSSGVEDIMFAGRKIEGNGDKTVMYPEIKYLRHLFNVCYWEKINESSNKQLNITYKQKADIVYSNKYIYNSSSPNTTIDSFITVPTLGSASTYQGEGNSIIDLKLDSNVLNAENIGIFGLNKGTIKDLNIINASLNSNISSDSSGSGLIAGKNENTISGVEVTLTGNVNKNAGGIAGINEGTIDNCIANGEITGENNIGGIAGYNKGNYGQSKRLISNCKTTITVYAKEKDSSNLGGIAGLNSNNGIVKECVYEPVRNFNEVIYSIDSNPFSDSGVDRDYLLYGMKVGGIVGYNTSNGKVENCKTDTDNNGYVIGFRAVGGIIGYDDNSADGYIISDSYESGYNELNVVGANLLGGIVGTLEGAQKDSITLGNWKNSGVIVSRKSTSSYGYKQNYEYGGGITSWLGKKGTISNCKVDIDVNDATKNELIQYSNGNYIGGIVGQNKGKITSNESYNGVTVEHQVLVGGGDIIGGLVGHNEGRDANNNQFPNGDNRNVQIEYQKIIKGIVYGNDYVGGVIGCNQTKLDSQYFFQESHSNITVNGNQYVGGIIGYNTLSFGIGWKYPSHENIVVNGKQDVGGIVGFNHKDAEIINQFIIGTINGEENTGGVVGNNEGQLSYNINNTDNIYNSVTVNGGKNTGGIVGINSNNISSNSETKNNVTVSGTNYVGGLAGYNSSSINNMTVALCTVNGNGKNIGGLIGENRGSLSKNDNSQITVSVSNINVNGENVGGLIGTNISNNASIYRFPLKDSTISNSGNFTGGLIGCNKGTITSGELFSSYITVSGNEKTGGIFGRNDGNLKISVSVNGDVTGTNETGGLVGFNNGKMETGQLLTVSINVAGKENTGGVCGQNVGDINTGFVIDGNVTGTNRVGGAVGYNSGLFGNNQTTNVKCNVTGIDAVGGICGENKGSFKNTVYSVGSVIGNDYVGGLYGIFSGSISTYAFENAVTVTGNNYVGGLAGQVKNVTIIQNVTGSVTGNNYVGGLFGSFVSDDELTIIDSRNVKDLTVTGNNYVAGIVPVIENNIKVNNCKMDGISIIANTGISGGITSINKGIINKCSVINTVFKYKNEVTNIGGIAGQNLNTITGKTYIIDNKFENVSDNDNHKTIIGYLAGKNGSEHILNPDRMAIIEDSNSFNTIQAGDAEPYLLVGLNLAKLNNCSSYTNSNKEQVVSTGNSSIDHWVRNDDFTISEPATQADGSVIFSFDYDSNYNYRFSLFGINIMNGEVIQELIYNCNTGDGVYSYLIEDDKFKYILDNQRNIYNGYRIVVDKLESNGKRSHIKEYVTFCEVPLPDIKFTVNKDENNPYEFNVSYLETETDEKEYIEGYKVLYQIDGYDYETTDSSILFDSSYNGKSVKFAVISIAKSDAYFHSKSNPKWSEEFLIGDGLNLITVENDNQNVTSENSAGQNSEIGIDTSVNSEEGENENETVTQE